MKSLFFSMTLAACAFICTLSALGSNDANVSPTLDEYLATHYPQGLAEGGITPAQRDQFVAFLIAHPDVSRVMEIGLNGGHSAEMFFQNCKNLENFLSFDICYWPYVKVAVNYFKEKYQDRFSFVEGPSQKKIPEYAKLHKRTAFDLIYIDGSHLCSDCFQDIVNSRALAHRNTILWIDDFNIPDVEKAVTFCEQRGIIRIVQVHNSSYQGDPRSWVEARYTK